MIKIYDFQIDGSYLLFIFISGKGSSSYNTGMDGVFAFRSAIEERDQSLSVPP